MSDINTSLRGTGGPVQKRHPSAASSATDPTAAIVAAVTGREMQPQQALSINLTSTKEGKRLLCLLSASLVSLLLFILSFSCRLPSSFSSGARLQSNPPIPFRGRSSPSPSVSTNPPPPSIAYFITGSNGDGDRVLRLLHAVYHPKNRYLLHLDRSASQVQRERLALAVQSVPVFKAAGNVDVMGKPDAVNPQGSTVVSSTLHGAAIMLRYVEGWDWFINLSASDYPLITQDDLLHLLSFVPRELNFIQHTSRIGWKEYRKLKPIIVDPGLYLLSKSEVFYGTQRRDIPSAYKFFTGSAFVILSHKFIEYCILGLDNLPRTLLMYYTNVPASHECYFHTVACNAEEFKRTIVNENLQFAAWDSPQKLTHRMLQLADFENMTKSGAAFAQSFKRDDSVLDKIDEVVLNRQSGKVVPGAWCIGKGADPCVIWGDADILMPGDGAKRVERLLIKRLTNETFHSMQCAS